MNKPLDSQDYVAGALAAVRGNIEVKPVAFGYYEPTAFSWYRVYDPSSDECRAVLAGSDDATVFCAPCSPDDKSDFTKAFLKTLNFGGREDDPTLWLAVLDKGGVDPEWVDLQILRPILEKGAAELGTDFNFEVWAVKGVLVEKHKGKKRKQADP
jgi:hypothetical protein